VIEVEVRKQNGIDSTKRAGMDIDLASKVSHALPQDRVGQQPHPVELDQHGTVPNPGEVCYRTLLERECLTLIWHRSGAATVGLVP
jgi:hypothetical protein